MIDTSAHICRTRSRSPHQTMALYSNPKESTMASESVTSIGMERGRTHLGYKIQSSLPLYTSPRLLPGL
jgi:hypothetical protein